MPIELVCEGATAVLLPEYGGRLHQLIVPLGGGSEPLLVSPDDTAHYRTAPSHGGSFPMAPWPNRIRDGHFAWHGRHYAVPTDGAAHAIHGLAVNARWDVVARTPRICEMTIDLDDRWPWPARVWQRYELAPGELRMKLEVRALRDAFPAGCGWHPWFRRNVGNAQAVRVQLPSRRMYELVNHLPTGAVREPGGEFDLRTLTALGDRRLDDCYAGLTGPVVLDWGALALELTVVCAEPHVMVFSPPEALCIELQTCAPDAFNRAQADAAGTGFAVAEPGRAVSIASTWRWSTPG